MPKRLTVVFYYTIFLLLVLPANAVFAVKIKYDFKMGYRYIYDENIKTASAIVSPELPSKKILSSIKDKFSLSIVYSNENVAIVDISNKNGTTRRYIRSNGTIESAPTEAGNQIPLFLTFPTKDWAVGDNIRIARKIKRGNTTVPAVVNMKLNGYDAKSGQAEIVFTISIALPQEKLRTKHFLMRGKLIFNTTKGCIDKLQWQYNYKFSFSNKQVAVMRHLWSFEEKNQVSIKLKRIIRSEQ